MAAAGPLETRNSMLDAIQAAANSPAESFASLGGKPVEPSGFAPWPDPTPAIGSWTERDAAWLNVANDPENLGKGLSAEEIVRRWQAGEEPPGVVTRDALVVSENKYLDGLTDPGRKAFHELARQELEQRHEGVKSVLDDVRNQLGAGEFRGEEHYRKFAKSLDRKLNEIPGLSFEEFAKPGAGLDLARAKLNGLALEVNDALRYTMVFDENDYARGAHETLKALQAAGCRLLDERTLPDGTKVPGVRPLLDENGRLPDGAKFAKNFWREGNRYLGINLTLVDEHGGPFELQFHTPESFDVKQQLSHFPYEIYRRPELSVESRVNSMLELVGMSDHYLSGHVPDGLEDFAPRSKDASLDKLFGDVREDVQKQIDQARTPHERARAEQQMAELEERRRSLMEANREELAAHLRRLGRDDLGPQEVGRLVGETVELVKAGEQLKAASLLKTGEPLNLDPAGVRREHFTTPSYEPPAHGAAPAHENTTTPHGENNDHPTALGQSPLDPGDPAAAGHHPVAHLDDPIRISPDHLVFQMRDENGDLAFAHLQQINDRWVLHTGGGDSATLSSIGENLRTTLPGLDLIGHASPDGFVVNGHTVPFEDVLAHIPDATTGDGPIRLIACDAGGANGEAAQRLADLSGRKVVAADSTVWVSKDGHVVASNPVDRATNWYPRRPADGTWSVYEPGKPGQSRPIHVGDPDAEMVPKAPEGWDSGHGGERHEFQDLGFDHNKPRYTSPDRRSQVDRDAARAAQERKADQLDKEFYRSRSRAFQKEFGIKRPRKMVEREHLVFDKQFSQRFEVRREIALKLLDKNSPPYPEFDVDKPGYKPQEDSRSKLELEQIRGIQRTTQARLLAERQQTLDKHFATKFGIPRPAVPTLPEHIDFLRRQTVILQVTDAAQVKALDIGAPAHVGFDFNHYPEGGVSIHAALLADELDGAFAKNFRQPAADFVNNAAFKTDTLLHPGQPIGESNPRLVMDWRSEIHRVARHPLGHGVEEHASFAGIPLEDHGMGHGSKPPTPGQQITSFAGSSPQSGHMGDGYGAIEQEYHKFVEYATREGTGQTPQAIDKAFGSALRTLLKESDPVLQRAGLEKLAADVYGTTSPIYGTPNWQDTPSGRLLIFGARTAHLVAHIEIGRNPEAITNLMALRMAADGELPMDDVFAYRNIMSPSGAAILGRLDRALNAGIEVPDIRAGILPMPRSAYRDFDPDLAAQNLAEFRSRRLQIIAEFAYSEMRRLPDGDPSRAAFYADPAGWLAANPGFVLDQLVKAF